MFNFYKNSTQIIDGVEIVGVPSFDLVGFCAIVLLLICGSGLYFLPSVVAFVRAHKDKWLIFIINFFFGWTGILWFVAFIWAIFSKKE
ncbi:superinfection immunity protein [Helicobacter sp. T3_23-1056]